MKIYGTVIVDGTPCPVTNLIDATGEETDEISEVVTAVVKVAEDEWAIFILTPDEIWPLQ